MVGSVLENKGYVRSEKIFDTSGSFWWRGHGGERGPGGEGTPFLFKCRGSPESSREAQSLRREFELLKTLEFPGVAKPVDYISSSETDIMVLENVEGDFLEKLLDQRKIDWQSILLLAGRLASILESLHASRVIHGHITPASIMVPSFQDACLVDFSWAVQEGDDSLSEYELGSPRRNWAYVSPEQTGRLNNAVDYRTDFYSLGILLYRMLTGQLPFNAGDPLEWVHSHIARTPLPPADVDSGIPAMVSAIVMKLMSKQPDERYQSGHGLAADIEKCLEAWARKGDIEPFELGREDNPPRLHIAKRLYGRERERERLDAVVRRLLDGEAPELFLISGYSGVGKSSLVEALQIPVLRSGGFFLSGKFDPYKRNIPYSTLAQAFQGMLKQILAGSEESIVTWRLRFQDALGSLGRIIEDIIPSLALILGEAPPAAELPPIESQARFNGVFRRFLGVFATAEHPMVLFLDDVQWADPAGLDLIRHVITHPDTHHLLIIAAFRSNEVDAIHPLREMIERLPPQGARVEEMALTPLAAADLAHLIADSLRCDEGLARPLADLVHGKTGGNPFFAIQFLTNLYGEELLRYDPATSSWRWDMERIEERGYTDNVVELMVQKLNRLPLASRNTMMLAACLGNMADEETLARLAENSEEAIHKELAESMREGFMTRKRGAYVFPHDRIRQAAYTLFPETRRIEAHMRIGRLLLARVAPDKLEDNLFDVASHFMLGASALSDPDEKDDVAALFLKAGRKAKASTAYRSAADLLAAGMSLIAEQDWDKLHKLAYNLHLDRAECEWLTGNFAEAERLLAVLFAHTCSNIEKLAVYRIETQLHKIRGEMSAAIESGLKALKLIGMDWSPHPTVDQVEAAYAKVWEMLGNRSIESLIDLPPMTDREMLSAMEIASDMVDAAVWVDDNLLQLLGCFMVTTSLRHGNSISASFGYATFAGAIGPALGRYEDAYRLGRVAYGLNERLGAVMHKSKICFMLGAAILLWVRPYQNAAEYYERGIRAGTEIGDILWASYCASSDLDRLFIEGAPLTEVFRVSQRYLEFTRKLRFDEISDSILIIQRIVQSLRGLTESLSTFTGSDFDQTLFEKTLEEKHTPLTVCYYYVWRLQACFLSGDYPEAQAAGAKAKELLWTNRWLYPFSEYHFYHALTLAAEARGKNASEIPEVVDGLKEHATVYKIWAESCPENFASKHALIEAETARITGDTLQAERLYHKAIRAARDGGLIQNEAIALELAAAFYRERDLEAFADMCLRESRACYRRWGADGKVRQLEAEIRRLHAEKPASAKAMEPFPGPQMDDGGTVVRADFPERAVAAENLDMLTIVKATQALSGEIVLDRLVERLVKITMENAGAENCWLILARDEVLIPIAEAVMNRENLDVRIHPDMALTSAPLPSSIIAYVQRSREKVILADGAGPNPFSGDPYFLRRHPKSVLCFPILQQSELIGILYLENTLVANTFSPGRFEVLEMIASQAAISLENARLYTGLQKENAERKQAEAALTENQRFLQDIINTSSAVIYVKDLEGRYLLINHRYEEIFHVANERSNKGIIGKTDFALFPKEFADACRENDARTLQEGRPIEYEEVIPHDDGLHTYISIKCALRNPSGEPYAVCGISTEITQLKRMEEQLRQSQKMDAIGRLAGGVAHDFNNLLTAINGYSGLALEGLEATHPMHEYIREIQKSGERASRLTRQLLTYSRKLPMEMRVLDLNEIVLEIQPMLRRLIRESIHLETHLDETTCFAKVDRGQVEQIILNLVVNARDAMPNGGNLIIETERIFLNRNFIATHLQGSTGLHVMLTVTDTGRGMLPEVKSRIFEPFFTTKEVGKGTGLGLSVVYGIVKQSGGGISIFSEPGKGTTIRIYFPEARKVPKLRKEETDSENSQAPGKETILLVEDEESVRKFARRALEMQGYTIVEAVDGLETLKMLERPDFHPDLLITDVVMPNMGGKTLAEKVRMTHPSIPVLFISGYAEDFIENQSLLNSGASFLQKPFQRAELVQKVHEILRSADAGASGRIHSV